MKQLQQKVQQMYKDNGWDTQPELLLLAIQEELGEICARFLAEHPGYKKNINSEEWIINTIKKRSKQK